MSDEKVVTIKTLAGEFEKGQLQEYCNKQFIALKQAQKQMQEMQLEIDHLKKLLADSTSIVGDASVSKIIAPSEQEICEIQIKKIKDRSLDKELTFEDAKKLETYVRTLKIIKEKDAPVREAKSRRVKDISDAELVAIAAQPSEEEKIQ